MAEQAHQDFKPGSMDISDHICVMNEGRKIAEGAPAQVAINEAVVAAYLGAKRAAA